MVARHPAFAVRPASVLSVIYIIFSVTVFHGIGTCALMNIDDIFQLYCASTSYFQFLTDIIKLIL